VLPDPQWSISGNLNRIDLNSSIGRHEYENLGICGPVFGLAIILEIWAPDAFNM
jgi:hypothetical protein